MRQAEAGILDPLALLTRNDNRQGAIWHSGFLPVVLRTDEAYSVFCVSLVAAGRQAEGRAKPLALKVKFFRRARGCIMVS